ncbi:MAG: flavoprotein [Planctomycetota bacterium]|nr:flavoprotein [Planctomycetota bacterium]MDI6788234.1 flavoprotein [Planctomycetota bacterium]
MKPQITQIKKVINNIWEGKEIGIGVTGSIACYKAGEIVSSLYQSGCRVTVLMTKSSTKFVSPLTFQTLSHNRVLTDLFDEQYEFDPQHIALAQRLDLLLIAPASANIIGKIASGIADDILSTLVMSIKPSKVIIAPAMNEKMYLNPIVQRNITFLKKAGYRFIEPEKGQLACGTGIGRLPSPDKIIKYLAPIFPVGRHRDKSQ